jgi:uncharacterized Zn-binding protein involved in type VI secretion
MAAAARASGQDRVFSRTGARRNCNSPMETTTGAGSSTVFINGYGAIAIGDLVGAHPRSGCGPDVSTLTTGSSTVFVGGVGIGRIGDEYTSDNIIISGSTNVFIG